MAGELYDGLLSVLGGVDAGTNPEFLPENKIADARNLTISGGRAQTRPDFVKVMTLPPGTMQGGGFFSFSESIIAQINGWVQEIFPTRKTYRSIVPQVAEGVAPQNPNRPRIWTCETEQTFILQDGQAKPILYDGYEARRAADDEVPVGQAMAYGNKRLSVVVGLGNRVRVGDIFQPDVAQSELKFTETSYLLGGGDFSFPAPVTALLHLPVLDTATGAGSLLVATRKSIYSLSTDVTNRDLWSDMNGFQSVLFPRVGIMGQVGWDAVNQDVWFRASDGIRSLRMSVAEHGTPGNTPVSTEVKHRLDYDAQHLLQDCSVVYFDNRLLVTTVPLHYNNRAMYHSIVSLNFDAMHNMGQSSPPAYDGCWDGVKVLQFIKGEVDGRERLYFLGIDPEGNNALYEVKRESESTYRLFPQDTVNPAKEITTRSMNAQYPSSLKRLLRADLAFSRIDGDVDVKLYYRPDRFPYFMLWDTWSFTSQVDLDESDVYVWDPAGHGYRMKQSTKAPPEDYHWMNDRGIDTGFSFQFKLVWTGRAQLDSLRVKMLPLPDPDPADNPVESDNKTRPSSSELSVPIYVPDDEMFSFYTDGGDTVAGGLSYLTTGDGLTIFTTGDGTVYLGLGSNT